MLTDIARIPHAERDGNYLYDPPTPVPIFQHQWEWATLMELYRTRAPLRTLEIGTHAGGTLYRLLQQAPVGATVVSIDSYTAHFDNRHLYADWTPEGVRLEVI